MGCCFSKEVPLIVEKQVAEPQQPQQTRVADGRTKEASQPAEWDRVHTFTGPLQTLRVMVSSAGRPPVGSPGLRHECVVERDGSNLFIGLFDGIGASSDCAQRCAERAFATFRNARAAAAAAGAVEVAAASAAHGDAFHPPELDKGLLGKGPQQGWTETDGGVGLVGGKVRPPAEKQLLASLRATLEELDRWYLQDGFADGTPLQALLFSGANVVLAYLDLTEQQVYLASLGACHVTAGRTIGGFQQATSVPVMLDGGHIHRPVMDSLLQRLLPVGAFGRPAGSCAAATGTPQALGFGCGKDSSLVDKYNQSQGNKALLPTPVPPYVGKKVQLSSHHLLASDEHLLLLSAAFTQLSSPADAVLLCHHFNAGELHMLKECCSRRPAVAPVVPANIVPVTAALAVAVGEAVVEPPLSSGEAVVDAPSGGVVTSGAEGEAQAFPQPVDGAAANAAPHGATAVPTAAPVVVHHSVPEMVSGAGKDGAGVGAAACTVAEVSLPNLAALLVQHAASSSRAQALSSDVAAIVIALERPKSMTTHQVNLMRVAEAGRAAGRMSTYYWHLVHQYARFYGTRRTFVREQWHTTVQGAVKAAEEAARLKEVAAYKVLDEAVIVSKAGRISRTSEQGQPGTVSGTGVQSAASGGSDRMPSAHSGGSVAGMVAHANGLGAAHQNVGLRSPPSGVRSGRVSSNGGMPYGGGAYSMRISGGSFGMSPRSGPTSPPPELTELPKLFEQPVTLAGDGSAGGAAPGSVLAAVEAIAYANAMAAAAERATPRGTRLGSMRASPSKSGISAAFPGGPQHPAGNAGSSYSNGGWRDSGGGAASFGGASGLSSARGGAQWTTPASTSGAGAVAVARGSYSRSAGMAGSATMPTISTAAPPPSVTVSGASEQPHSVTADGVQPVTFHATLRPIANGHSTTLDATPEAAATAAANPPMASGSSFNFSSTASGSLGTVHHTHDEAGQSNHGNARHSPALSPATSQALSQGYDQALTQTGGLSRATSHGQGVSHMNDAGVTHTDLDLGMHPLEPGSPGDAERAAWAAEAEAALESMSFAPAARATQHDDTAAGAFAAAAPSVDDHVGHASSSGNGPESTVAASGAVTGGGIATGSVNRLASAGGFPVVSGGGNRSPSKMGMPGEGVRSKSRIPSAGGAAGNSPVFAAVAAREAAERTTAAAAGVSTPSSARGGVASANSRTASISRVPLASQTTSRISPSTARAPAISKQDSTRNTGSLVKSDSSRSSASSNTSSKIPSPSKTPSLATQGARSGSFGSKGK